ncbi:MAG: c-type cytochrome [Pseudomonadota bacterium]
MTAVQGIPAAAMAGDVGELIYQQGRTSAATATIGNSGHSAPATLFACRNCHGDQAQGKKETGMVAPDITWNQLTSGYRADADGGTRRNAYNLSSFGAAVSSGVDSEGRRLSSTMPRYKLTTAEIQSLASYLATVELATAAGVSANEIVVHLELPEHPRLAEAVRVTVDAYVSRLNNAGGVYRRQLKIVTGTFDPAGVFCVLDLRLRADTSVQTDKPVLGWFAADTPLSQGVYLYRHPTDYGKKLLTKAQQQGWQAIDAQGKPVSGVIAQLQTQSVKQPALVVYNTNVALPELFTALAKEQLTPVVILSADVLENIEPALVQEYNGRILVAAPPGAESVSDRGIKEWGELSGYYASAIDARYLSARLWTLSLLKLIESALQHAGRSLTAQNFLDAVLSQVDLETGFGPALSFAAHRRIGYDDVVLQSVN